MVGVWLYKLHLTESRGQQPHHISDGISVSEASRIFFTWVELIVPHTLIFKFKVLPPKPVYLPTRLVKPVCPTIYSWEKRVFHAFPRALAESDTLTASSKIWMSCQVHSPYCNWYVTCSNNFWTDLEISHCNLRKLWKIYKLISFLKLNIFSILYIEKILIVCVWASHLTQSEKNSTTSEDFLLEQYT